MVNLQEIKKILKEHIWMTHPVLSLLLFHHSIKEEDQCDACWRKGLHPVLQDIHVLPPLPPTHPVLTWVPVAQASHTIHNKSGIYMRDKTEM